MGFVFDEPSRGPGQVKADLEPMPKAEVSKDIVATALVRVSKWLTRKCDVEESHTSCLLCKEG